MLGEDSEEVTGWDVGVVKAPQEGTGRDNKVAGSHAERFRQRQLTWFLSVAFTLTGLKGGHADPCCFSGGLGPLSPHLRPRPRGPCLPLALSAHLCGSCRCGQRGQLARSVCRASSVHQKAAKPSAFAHCRGRQLPILGHRSAMSCAPSHCSPAAKPLPCL